MFRGMSNFAIVLEHAHAAGISDTVLGRLAGVDPSSIWRWRTSRRTPSIENVDLVLEAISRLGIGATDPVLAHLAGSGGRRPVLTTPPGRSLPATPKSAIE